MTIFDTVTMSAVVSERQTDEQGVIALGMVAVVVNDRQAFHVAADDQKNRRLIEITVGVN